MVRRPGNVASVVQACVSYVALWDSRYSVLKQDFSFLDQWITLHATAPPPTPSHPLNRSPAVSKRYEYPYDTL